MKFSKNKPAYLLFTIMILLLSSCSAEFKAEAAKFYDFQSIVILSIFIVFLLIFGSLSILGFIGIIKSFKKDISSK